MAFVDKFETRDTKIRERFDEAQTNLDAAVKLANGKLPSGLKDNQEKIDYLVEEDFLFRECYLQRGALLKTHQNFSDKFAPSYLKMAFELS
jgi:hypothetical protein